MQGIDMRIIEVQETEASGAIAGLVDDLMNLPDNVDAIIEVPQAEVENLAEVVELGSATVGVELAEQIREQAAQEDGVEIHVPPHASTGLACLIQSGLERIDVEMPEDAGH